MMVRSNSQTILILLVSDIVSLSISYRLAIHTRLLLNDSFSRQFTIDRSFTLLPQFPLILATGLLCLLVVGLYDPGRIRPPLDTVRRVVPAVVMGITLLIGASFFFSRTLYSRSLMGLLLLSSTIVVGLARLLTHWILSCAGRAGLPVSRVALIGNGREAEHVIDRLSRPGNEQKLEGLIVARDNTTSGTDGLRVLGPLKQLQEIIHEKRLHQIVVTDNGLSEMETARIAGICEKMGVRLDQVADLFTVTPRQISIINGLPLVNLVSLGESRWDYLVKRGFDFTLSFVLTVLSLPAFFLIALAIRLDSPGPILFVQRRRGKAGRHFEMLKFRSMILEAEELRPDLAGLNEKDGAIFKLRRDPRVTRVGRVLRRFSLDELPQLINVLRGEMSFVGPRPLPIDDIKTNSDDAGLSYWFEKRESVPPGITGLWQVRGRSDLNTREMAVLDLFYVRSWSFFLDLQILARTVPVVLLGRGAY